MGKLKSHNYHLLKRLSSPKNTYVKLKNLINILPGVKRTTPPEQIILTERKGVPTNTSIPIATSIAAGTARAHVNAILAVPPGSIIGTTIKHDATPPAAKIIAVMYGKKTIHDLALGLEKA
jgi:hypothetical protein